MKLTFTHQFPRGPVTLIFDLTSDTPKCIGSRRIYAEETTEFERWLGEIEVVVMERVTPPQIAYLSEVGREFLK